MKRRGRNCIDLSDGDGETCSSQQTEIRILYSRGDKSKRNECKKVLPHFVYANVAVDGVCWMQEKSTRTENASDV